MGRGALRVRRTGTTRRRRCLSLVFRSTPLADAVAEINRYRSGRIFVTNAALGRRLFNARFPIANVDGVVAQIQQVFGASVTTLPGGIVLLG